ncbi:MAG: adenosylmethionine decarboxylase [Proteobacteria bacterium]|nr:adenosylmethionine decarboxylase [Pseudomonadota bacterium]MBQ9243336.1 adenosylmethionine decarboxylase [Pseudomonadota bacterium]
MNTFGHHLLVEYYDCNKDTLNDPQALEAMMIQAAHAANATIVKTVFHQFAPQGVSGIIVIEESHLSIHTWPEHGYAAVDFYTCGKNDPERAHEVLQKALASKRFEIMIINRGILPD